MRLFALVGMVFGAAALFAVVAASAGAETVFCTPGSGAGQCSSPASVAVDDETGQVYVADVGNQRIDIFEADGTSLGSFGAAGTGAGQFALASSTTLAVDNDSSSAAFHDVYVYDRNNNRVQRFTPAGAFVLAFGKEVDQTSGGDVCTAASGHICKAGVGGTAPGQFVAGVRGPKIALAPGGVVYAVDNIGSGNVRLQKFQPSGAFVEQIGPLAPGDFGNLVAGLAVDSSGAFYFASGESVRKYSAGGALLSGEKTFGFGTNALAVDGADNLFIANSISLTPFPDGSLGAQTAIYEFNAAEEPVRTFYGRGALHTKPVSLALRSDVFGDVFAAEGGFASELRVVKIPFPPPGPEIPTEARLLGAEPVGAVRATLRASVNPEGVASKVRFEYVKVAICEADEEALGPEHCFDGAHVTPEADVEGTDFKLHPAKATIACDSESPAEGSCLEPETAYRFRAVAFNPDGEITSPAADFTTLGPIELGEAWSTGVFLTTATLHAELDPRSLPTTGFFEYVDAASFESSGFAGAAKAPNVDAGSAPIDFGSGEGMTVRGALLSGLQPGIEYRYRYVADDFFGSFPGPPRSFTTSSAGIPSEETCPNALLRSGASAALPDCRAYEMVSPVETNGGDIVNKAEIGNRHDAYIQSSADGDKLTYSAAAAFGNQQSSVFSNQYIATRGAEGWSNDGINAPQGTQSEQIGGFAPAQLNNYFGGFSADLCSAWLEDLNEVALTPEGTPGGARNYYRRDNCGAGAGGYRSVGGEFRGAAADGGHVVVQPSSGTGLPSGSGSLSESGIYDVHGGEASLVNVLPGGATAAPPVSVGGAALVDNTIGTLERAVSADGSRIFWTKLLIGESAPAVGRIYARIDGERTVSVSGPEGEYRTASSDGRFVLYIESGKLWKRDVDAETSTLVAGGEKGVLGASEDLSRIYFVSSEALAGAAVAGKPNLYLDEEGEKTFIATLASLDVPATITYEHPYNVADDDNPNRRTSRVAPDGSRIAFQSIAPLTGFDNTDAANGKPNVQVFTYAAGGNLDCVSCDPTGARQEGKQLQEPYKYPVYPSAVAAKSMWAAAWLPSWEHPQYASNALSRNGNRLFFHSNVPLVRSDTNGAQDVYQWEAPGEGNCTESSPTYSSQHGGCVSLISSGENPHESEFFDASPDGRDVFFTTAASLAPQDLGLVSVYDARVDGGFPPPAPPSPCVGDSCQSVPAPPAFPGSASSGFHGAGNASPPARTCAAPARRAQKLSRRAKLLRRHAKSVARSSSGSRRAERMRQKATRLAKRAHKLSGSAKRCRRTNNDRRAGR